MLDQPPKKRKIDRARIQTLLRDAWDLVWRSRSRLLIGIPLLLINRLSSIVLPAMTKFLIDDVIAKGRHEMLWKLAAISAVIILAIEAVGRGVFAFSSKSTRRVEVSITQAAE